MRRFQNFFHRSGGTRPGGHTSRPLFADTQPAPSAAPAAPTVRPLRTVVFIDAKQLIFMDRGGEAVSLARVPDFPVSAVYHVKLARSSRAASRHSGDTAVQRHAEKPHGAPARDIPPQICSRKAQ